MSARYSKLAAEELGSADEEPAPPTYAMVDLQTYTDEEGGLLAGLQHVEENPSSTGERESVRRDILTCCGYLCGCCWEPLMMFAFAFFIVVGSIYGIELAVEYGLTGEAFSLAPGHEALFRICESPSTTGSLLAVHTCNVFRPNQPVDAAPIHYFTENVRLWQSLNDWAGWATRVEPVTLDNLLLSRNLSCTKNPNSVRDGNNVAQIMVGGVGQNQYGLPDKTAVACNYNGEGRNIQTYCAQYQDGGRKVLAWPHPLSINEIMGKHFGMSCTWV